MKLLFVAALIGAGVLGCALVARAQEEVPKPHDMTGCLAKGTADKSFILNNVEGNGPKSVGIVSSIADLAPHVSHKIMVTGTNVPVKEAEAMSPAPPKAPHYMKLTAVKMLSTTCL